MATLSAVCVACPSWRGACPGPVSSRRTGLCCHGPWFRHECGRGRPPRDCRGPADRGHGLVVVRSESGDCDGGRPVVQAADVFEERHGQRDVVGFHVVREVLAPQPCAVGHQGGASRRVPVGSSVDLRRGFLSGEPFRPGTAAGAGAVGHRCARTNDHAVAAGHSVDLPVGRRHTRLDGPHRGQARRGRTSMPKTAFGAGAARGRSPVPLTALARVAGSHPLNRRRSTADGEPKAVNERRPTDGGQRAGLSGEVERWGRPAGR